MTYLSKRSLLLCAAAVCAAYSLPVLAQSYPTKPIHLVVPFTPGGSSDILARAIGQKLTEAWGQPVVIDNKAGASGFIASQAVAKAAPDGYTVLITTNTTHAANEHLFKKLPYDPVKDFAPIAALGKGGQIMVVNPDFPARTVAEFVALAKKEPGKYSFGSGSSSSRMAGELLQQMAGIKLLHVPYKSTPPAIADLIGGQVPFAFDTVTAAAPQIKAGKVKAIAVTTARRSPLLPNVPTFAESGYPAVVLDSWGMVAGPHGLPAAVQAKLEKALDETIADASVRAKLADLGVEAGFVGSAQAAAHLEAELPLMRAIAVRANIQPD